MDSTAVTVSQEIAGKVIDSISKQPQITWEHIALVIIGAFMYNILILQRLIRTKTKFSFKRWIKENWISLIMSGLGIVAAFLLKDELKPIMGFDMTNRVGCFLAGFTIHTIGANLAAFGEIAAKKTKGMISDSNNTDANSDGNSNNNP